MVPADVGMPILCPLSSLPCLHPELPSFILIRKKLLQQARDCFYTQSPASYWTLAVPVVRCHGPCPGLNAADAVRRATKLVGNEYYGTHEIMIGWTIIGTNLVGSTYTLLHRLRDLQRGRRTVSTQPRRNDGHLIVRGPRALRRSA
jgi:hypothetical protein